MKKIFDIKLIKFTKKQLAEIGFDKSYINKGTQKHIFKSIKINNLTCAQANILKQTAISVGIDCAVHREVITGKVELSDCILSGSENQIIKVAVKLQKQPFSSQFLPDLRLPAVAADHLVGHVVAIVQGHFLHRMGKADGFSGTFAGSKGVRPFPCKFPVIAQAQHHSFLPVFFFDYTAFFYPVQEKIPRNFFRGIEKIS